MKFLKRYQLHIALGIIILLAAFLRLYRISDYMTFLGDEGRDALIVKGILEGHFTLLGPRSSAGDFYVGPLYYYMMAPFLWLWHLDPVGPAIMIAILSIITVWFIFYLAKKFMGTIAALTAASLYAVSPLVITYAHSSWNPNPMPLFTLATFYCVYNAIKKQSLKLFFLTGILYGMSLELHYIEIFVGVTILFFVLLGNLFYNRFAQTFESKGIKKIHVTFFLFFKQYFAIFLGFLIGFSLFILFELRHNFENSRAIFNFILHGDPTATDTTHLSIWQTISNVFFRLFGHLVFTYPTPDKFHLYPNWWLIIFAFIVVVFSLGAMYTLRFVKDKLFLLLLSLWTLFGITLFSLYHKPINDYNFEFMFPLPFLLFGNFFQTLIKTKRWQPVLKIGAILLFIAIFIYALKWNPIQFAPNRQKLQMQTIADFVLSKTNNQPFNFAIISGGNSDFAYRYFFSIANDNPVPIDNTINDPKRTTVTKQLFVVCEDITCHPLGAADFEIAGFGRAQIADSWNVSVVKVFKLVHYTGK